MTRPEMKELENLLTDDLVDSDAAVYERTIELVKKFLLERVTRLSGKRVKNEAEVYELIRIHAHAGMLRKLIEKPEQFSAKDLKDLVRANEAAGKDPTKPVDMGSLVGQLDVPDVEKAQLLSAMTDLAAQQFRRKLEKPE